MLGNKFEKSGYVRNEEKYNNGSYQYKDKLKELTPKEETFDDIFSKDDIQRDQVHLSKVEEHDKKRKKDSDDPVVLERTFVQYCEQDDWFQDSVRRDEGEDDYDELSTIPTSKTDDRFNHTDLVAVINCKESGDKPECFAFDLTLRTGDKDEIRKKLKWKHLWGKNEEAPEDASEFGRMVKKYDKYGNKVIVPKPLKDEWRNGLKIPGFTSIKYAEDTNTTDADRQLIKKGRLQVIPRFVISYDPEIARTLDNGYHPEDTEKQRKFVICRKAARWCVLFECKEQAEGIKHLVDSLTEEQKKGMDQKELELAKEKVSIALAYFDRALEKTKEKLEKLKNDGKMDEYNLEKEALEKAKEDDYYKELQEQVKKVYYEGKWEEDNNSNSAQQAVKNGTGRSTGGIAIAVSEEFLKRMGGNKSIVQRKVENGSARRTKTGISFSSTNSESQRKKGESKIMVQHGVKKDIAKTTAKAINFPESDRE